MRIAAAVLERYEAAEAAKERQVGDVLLTHVQLAGQVSTGGGKPGYHTGRGALILAAPLQVAKLEAALAKREQLAEGLAMIDFEQARGGDGAMGGKVG